MNSKNKLRMLQEKANLEGGSRGDRGGNQSGALGDSQDATVAGV